MTRLGLREKQEEQKADAIPFFPEGKAGRRWEDVLFSVRGFPGQDGGFEPGESESPGAKWAGRLQTARKSLT